MCTATSKSARAALPSLPAAPQPTLQFFWEHPRAPLRATELSTGNPLGLSLVPSTSMVPGGSGICGVGTAVPLSITHVKSTGRPALCGGVEHSGPQHISTSADSTGATVPAAAATQNVQGTWVQGLHLPAPPALVQRVPIISSESMTPQPQAASVYENFRHWQKNKALVRTHLPHISDVEAFSCFLIPVLRTLARRNPNMKVEEGLQRGVREWKLTNTSEQMKYHEMANKFMEFEHEEKTEMAKLENMSGVQGHPPPGPPGQDPPRPPAPGIFQKPVCTSVKIDHDNHPDHPPAPKRKRSPSSKTPTDILPEANHKEPSVPHWLEGCLLSTTGQKNRQMEKDKSEEQQEEEVLYPDPGLLSYLDELCSQQDFLSKVEAIINTEFLDKMLSPDPDVDIVALNKELEEEEGLTLNQLVEKRLQSANKKRRMHVPWNPEEPQVEARTSVLSAEREAERENRNPQQWCEKRRYELLGPQKRRKKKKKRRRRN